MKDAAAVADSAPTGAGGVSAMRRRLAALILAPSVAACVMVPMTREVYDPECRMMRREVILEAAVIAQFYSCGGQECAAMLAAMGLVTAASVVVSGSLAIVGNVAYWFEHEANCRRLRREDAVGG